MIRTKAVDTRGVYRLGRYRFALFSLLSDRHQLEAARDACREPEAWLYDAGKVIVASVRDVICLYADTHPFTEEVI